MSVMRKMGFRKTAGSGSLGTLLGDLKKQAHFWKDCKVKLNLKVWKATSFKGSWPFIYKVWAKKPCNVGCAEATSVTCRSYLIMYKEILAIDYDLSDKDKYGNFINNKIQKMTCTVKKYHNIISMYILFCLSIKEMLNKHLNVSHRGVHLQCRGLAGKLLYHSHHIIFSGVLIGWGNCK